MSDSSKMNKASGASERKEWFGEWFDSPYYHILYKDRDYREAQKFMNFLSVYLDFRVEDKIMDLACGKGRHSIHLNKQGFDVTGVDLSPQSIASANQFANDRLSFEVHDMRDVFRPEAFDFVLNLFTSFGYFSKEEENRQAIVAASESLKPKGMMVLDFLNPTKVIGSLVAEEVKTVDGIDFHIKRYVDDQNYIVKDIRFTDNGHSYDFQERVKAISRSEFESYFQSAGLHIQGVFGDYALGAFDAETSDRMIFVAQKSN